MNWYREYQAEWKEIVETVSRVKLKEETSIEG